MSDHDQHPNGTPAGDPTDADVLTIDAATVAEMRRDQHLLKVLLEQTTDRIYFKDLECRFIRTSRSNALHFGLKSADEAIGKSDFDFFDSISAAEYYENEQK